MPINPETTNRVMIQLPLSLKKKIKARADKEARSVPSLIKLILQKEFS